MNNFKLSQRAVHRDCRSSIENVHDEYISKLQDEYSTLNDKLLVLNKLKVERDNLKKNKKHQLVHNLNEQIIKLEKQIDDINSQRDLTDYLFNAIPFIQEVDNQDKQEDNNNKKENIVEDVGILKYVTIDGKTDKGTRYADYMETCFNVSNHKKNYRLDCCTNCNSINRTIDTKEALIICDDCGTCEKHTETNGNIDWSRADSAEFIQIFTYKRKNHFKEWLTQLQAKESTIIPTEILEQIYLELKKERIINTDNITALKIRQYLKKLRLNKYYEHIPNIIRCITNKPGLIIDDELETKLMNMFDLIQEPFSKYCPASRKNFLSYSFTLHKFCQLLNRHDLLIYFPLLKSREKLFEQEKIWKNICKELNWEYVSTI